MMSHNEEYVVLTKEVIDTCLSDLGKLIKKHSNGQNVYCELIVVGGASILLNYGFRLSTVDIDCSDEYKVLMNDLISLIADKYRLPSNWINTNFVNTKSYSPKLARCSTHYKTFGNGVLEVRTIRGVYLLAMKIVSARKYKNDYSDMFGIIQEINKNSDLTMEMVDSAIIELYDSIDVADKDAYRFVKSIIDSPDIYSYEELRKKESSNFEIAKSKSKETLNQEDIEYILSKLNIE